MFDLSAYHVRQLDPATGVKPLDLGNGGITGSVNAEGRLIAVNSYHPAHGYMTLTSVPPFPDDARYDAAQVRAYRKAIAKNEGFGLAFSVPIRERRAYLIEDAIPYIHLTLKNGVTAQVITFTTVGDPAGVMQIWHFSERGDWVAMQGKMWLQRSAYTQLTEGGVLSAVSPVTQVAGSFEGGHSLLQNNALPATAHIYPAYFTPADDGSVQAMDINLFDHECDEHSIVLHIGLDADPARALLRYQATTPERAHQLLHTTLDHWRDLWTRTAIPAALPERRAISYGLRCCVPIDDDATCILTDHMLLPLSWTRDAYYVAQVLLMHTTQGADIVRGHLRWLFERAERPDGAWGRAYLANGIVKDRGFQLDQQLYPLLELAHYTLYTGDGALLNMLAEDACTVLEELLTRRDPDCGLIATDETPADDPIALPYHFSSHALLWRVLTLYGDLINNATYHVAADTLWAAIAKHFITRVDDRQLYAYATDGAGEHHLYHDANDIPLALMPLWNACEADDPVWLATIDFAWSDANQGGYYGSQLGSVHTPAAWPLGAAQTLLIAMQRGDDVGVETARAIIEQAAQWDGALPEAHDPQTYEVISRHWFAWPNVMLLYTEGSSSL